MRKPGTLIFYLLIFSIPIQARLILHEWTRPFNQWASAYLYGTDILLAAIFLFWLARNLRAAKISNSKFLISKQYSKFQIPNSKFFLVLFFIVSAVSIFNSRIIGLSFYQLLKLAEFVGFYFYLTANFPPPLKSAAGVVSVDGANDTDKRNDPEIVREDVRHSSGVGFSFQGVLIVIIASGLFQSVIAIAQYIKQGSLGLRLLGESPLSVNATGVAVFIADGVRYLRAYGTTPHPNILAAWLFVAIFAFYFYYFYLRKNNNPSVALAKEGSLLIVYAVLLFAFFFTFSRVVIGLWLAGITVRFLIVFFKKDLRGFFATAKKPLLALIIATIAATSAFSLMFWPQVKSRIHISVQEEAVTQRVYYNKIAGSVAAGHPLLGIGIGQFVPNTMTMFKHLPAVAHQPVHNIYLLIASETGFLGLGTFLIFLFLVFYGFAVRTQFKKLYYFSFFILAGSFLLVGFFDHFLWTSQQGSLVFWMALGLIGNNVKIELQ